MKNTEQSEGEERREGDRRRKVEQQPEGKRTNLALSDRSWGNSIKDSCCNARWEVCLRAGAAHLVYIFLLAIACV